MTKINNQNISLIYYTTVYLLILHLKKLSDRTPFTVTVCISYVNLGKICYNNKKCVVNPEYICQININSFFTDAPTEEFVITYGFKNVLKNLLILAITEILVNSCTIMVTEKKT